MKEYTNIVNVGKTKGSKRGFEVLLGHCTGGSGE